jgi:hypothetical protein
MYIEGEEGGYGMASLYAFESWVANTILGVDEIEDEDQFSLDNPSQTWPSHTLSPSIYGGISLKQGTAADPTDSQSASSYSLSFNSPPLAGVEIISVGQGSSNWDDQGMAALLKRERLIFSDWLYSATGTSTHEASRQDQSTMASFITTPYDSDFSADQLFQAHLDANRRYTTADTNVFIRALSMPIPNDENLEREFQEPMYRNLRAPDNYLDFPSDENLPRYFVRKYGPDTGTMGFPDVYGVMYAQSFSNPVLRHACLAVASFWAGRRVGHVSTQRSAVHINFLLPELQRVIRTRTFDDGHLCAVYLLMTFALDTNRFRVMQKHGEGLVLMLRHLGYLQPTSSGRHTISEHAPPLVIHVLRLALRDDNMCGFGVPGHYKLTLPPMEISAEPYERCMTSFLDQNRQHLKDIKLELYLKDLLTHRLLHFQSKVLSLRSMNAYRQNQASFESHITRQGNLIITEIQQQRQRISSAYLRTYSSRQVNRFLDHPPFYTRNWDTYGLFIYNSQTYLHATFVLDPKLGRSERFPDRTLAAVDLCRAAAAREKHLAPQAASLCFAGLAFINDYPQGIFVSLQSDARTRVG